MNGSARRADETSRWLRGVFADLEAKRDRKVTLAERRRCMRVVRLAIGRARTNEIQAVLYEVRAAMRGPLKRGRTG